MKVEVKYWKMLFIVLIAIAFYAGIHNVNVVMENVGRFLSLFLPFYIGCAIAFILNMPMSFLENKVLHKLAIKDTLKRIIAFFVSVIGFGVVIYVVIVLVAPELSATITTLIEEQLPKAVKIVQGGFAMVEPYLPLLDLERFNWDALVKDGIAIAQGAATGMLNHTVGIVGNIISGITTGFIGIIFAIYVLFQKERLATNFKKLFYAFFPTDKVERGLEILCLVNRTFSNFLSGQCMEAIILGIMFFVAMTLFKLPYALLTGVVIAVTALIPMFGAFIGLGIGAFLIVMVNPWQALGFVILFLVLQQIEGNFIYPYVVGNTVGLPAIWVLVAVTLGGAMLGVLGMLLYIPLFSVIYTLLREFVKGRLEKKHIATEKYQPHNSEPVEEEEETAE